MAGAGDSRLNSRGVRVVVAGDRGTGKSSLIVTVENDFPANVPPVLPVTKFRNDFFPERGPVTIVDTSSRQVSGQMYSDSAEYPAAVAAAVYAITIQDLSIETQTTGNAASRTLTNIMSKLEDKSTKVSEPRVELQEVTGKVPDKRILITAASNVNIHENVTAPVPSIRTSPTTANKRFNSNAADESKNADPESTGVSTLLIKMNQTTADKNVYNIGTGKLDYTVSKPDHQTIQTDAWEKAELAKITERYEVLNAKILQWESKQKTAAKRKLDKIESELEKKRAKAMQHYRTKVAMIDEIAGGARTKAEENRRHEEVQVKEKAYKIRTTGKYPASCLCF